ncbi:MAG: hypothetical protein O2895_05190 [Chloroflexi bacterium]|nr:hypothetical protein [Chloroflexota bacterium]
MVEALAGRVSDLTNLGWELKSQTETTAALEARRPFNWHFFALMLVLFPGFGGALYAAFWALTPNAHLFLSERNGEVITSGGTRLLTQQSRDVELARRINEDLHARGFWATVAPSLLAMTLVVLVWFAVVWAFVQLTF